ncbi:hypothetical protein, partial [Phytoactinopolyspora endophytica]|uniref:hypothetical protein n=1 Tax=Phytoactinopolyspora endophytica TaxID=1642495 RepID=UPI0013E9A993
MFFVRASMLVPQFLVTASRSRVLNERLPVALYERVIPFKDEHSVVSGSDVRNQRLQASKTALDVTAFPPDRIVDRGSGPCIVKCRQDLSPARIPFILHVQTPLARQQKSTYDLAHYIKF